MTFKLLYWCHIVPDFDSSTDGQCFPKRKYFYWIINGSDFRDHSSSVESGKLFYFQFLAEARLTDCLFCILYLVTWIWWNMWDYNSFNVITFSHKSQYNSLPQRSRKRTPTYSYSGEFDHKPSSVLLYETNIIKNFSYFSLFVDYYYTFNGSLAEYQSFNMISCAIVIVNLLDGNRLCTTFLNI